MGNLEKSQLEVDILVNWRITLWVEPVRFAANEECLSPLHSQEIESVGGGGGKRQATHGHFVMCLSWVARRLLI